MYAKIIKTKQLKVARPENRIVKRKRLGAILAEKRAKTIAFDEIKKTIAAEFNVDSRAGLAAGKIAEALIFRPILNCCRRCEIWPFAWVSATLLGCGNDLSTSRADSANFFFDENQPAPGSGPMGPGACTGHMGLDPWDPVHGPGAWDLVPWDQARGRSGGQAVGRS